MTSFINTNNETKRFINRFVVWQFFVFDYRIDNLLLLHSLSSIKWSLNYELKSWFEFGYLFYCLHYNLDPNSEYYDLTKRINKNSEIL